MNYFRLVEIHGPQDLIAEKETSAHANKILARSTRHYFRRREQHPGARGRAARLRAPNTQRWLVHSILRQGERRRKGAHERQLQPRRMVSRFGPFYGA